MLERLCERGHEVALRTLASAVAPMRAHGFAAKPIDPAVEALSPEDWRARTAAGAGVRAARTIAARARHDATDLLRAIEAERPDALLVDVLSWGALSAAAAWGGPWGCFAPPPLPLRSRAGPPPGIGLPPARGPLGRVRDRLLQPFIVAGFDRIALERLNAVRLELRLPALRHAEEIFLTPPLLLYMTAEPFEYPHPDWPERILMVGPCEWEPAGALPAELEAVEDPLVLVTTSTDYQDDARLVRTAVAALADEPFHLVATLPSAPLEGARAPANATLLRFAPHGPILDRCVCAITHGGIGATQKALGRGVPVCAVPFGRDQPEVARRVEVAGAGSRLAARRLGPEQLRKKVREAIACRPGAERVAAGFAAAGGAAAAADAFERRLLGVNR